MVNRLIAQAISLDESIVGVVLAGYKLHVTPLAGMITAYNIPAVAYIYSDDELMDQVKRILGKSVREKNFLQTNNLKKSTDCTVIRLHYNFNKH